MDRWNEAEHGLVSCAGKTGFLEVFSANGGERWKGGDVAWKLERCFVREGLDPTVGGWCSDREGAGEGVLCWEAGDRPLAVVCEEEPVPTEHKARMLACRVDAFYLSFQGVLLPEVRTELVARTVEARELHTAVAFAWGAFHGVLGATSREGWWKLDAVEAEVLLSETAVGGWLVEVKPRATFLHRESPRAALTWGWSIADALCGQAKAVRLRRMDLCADFVGFDLGEIDINAFQGRRKRAQSIAMVKEFAADGIRTGFVIGKSDVCCGIYDKTEELCLPRNDDGEKRDLEHAAWKLAGWDGKERVTRVEMRFRSGAMKELTITDPEEALRRIDGLWAYGTKKWVRLVVLGTATRRERMKLDERWARVQNVVFRRRMPPAIRTRETGEAKACRFLRASLNYAATKRRLAPLPWKGREHAATMSEGRAAGWVQMELNLWCGGFQGGEMAADLIAARGAQGAVAYIIELRNAVCARRGVRAVVSVERDGMSEAA